MTQSSELRVLNHFLTSLRLNQHLCHSSHASRVISVVSSFASGGVQSSIRQPPLCIPNESNVARASERASNKTSNPFILAAQRGETSSRPWNIDVLRPSCSVQRIASLRLCKRDLAIFRPFDIVFSNLARMFVARWNCVRGSQTCTLLTLEQSSIAIETWNFAVEAKSNGTLQYNGVHELLFIHFTKDYSHPTKINPFGSFMNSSVLNGERWG